jgi:hypothetical protein
MIYFDSDMSKSTNTVVYFDWKTVIYIYLCGKCRTQFMLPMEKSVTRRPEVKKKYTKRKGIVIQMINSLNHITSTTQMLDLLLFDTVE